MISFKYFDHTTRVKLGNAEMVISDAESEVRDGLKSIAEGLDEAVAEHGDEICQQIMAQDSLVDLLHRAIQVRNLRDALQERNLSSEEKFLLQSLQECSVKWVQNEAKAALHEASMPLEKPPSKSMKFGQTLHEALLGDLPVDPVDRFSNCPKNTICTPYGCEVGGGSWPRCPNPTQEQTENKP